jgi:hypothetical protein
MSATGLERHRENKGETSAGDESRSIAAQDPDLARVVDAWEGLSDKRRAMILRLLQWHEKAAQSNAEPVEGPAPWASRLQEAKDLGGLGTAGVALFEMPDGQYEAIGVDAINVADLGGLELLGDGEPWRAFCPGQQLAELLPRLTAAGLLVVVVDRLTPADLAAGRTDGRRVYRPTSENAAPEHTSEAAGGWTPGANPPALTEH